MEQTIKDVILLLGGWTVIITGIVSFISYLTTQKIIGSWETKNQSEIEILRNNQAETQLLLKDTISTISSSQSLLQTRRVEAVDKLWKAVLDLKIHYSPVTLFFGITLPIEYKSVLANSPMFTGLRTLNDNYIINFPQDEETYVENFRPYLGETLWLYFFVYRAFLGRLAFLVKWLAEGKEIGDWRHDTGIEQHLKAVFDKDEFNALMNSSPTEINYALNVLDSKVLREISYILSGRKSSLESFENSKELRKLLVNEKM
jgi:hypothetical protein